MNFGNTIIVYIILYFRSEYYNNYFLFHFFFKMACDKYYKDYINIPFYSNIPAHVLQYEIKDVYREKRYRQILGFSKIHKLTTKIDMNFTNDSFYSHIIREYS